MITQKELLEILCESPLYCWVDEFDLAIIFESLHEHIATQDKDLELLGA
ncbi:MAG: hypothetical protein HQL09_03815 [Nitrospirae bacterium]|nr:hypothetical protein [Nitrospirota bacterium]